MRPGRREITTSGFWGPTSGNAGKSKMFPGGPQKTSVELGWQGGLKLAQKGVVLSWKGNNCQENLAITKSKQAAVRTARKHEKWLMPSAPTSQSHMTPPKKRIQTCGPWSCQDREMIARRIWQPQHANNWPCAQQLGTRNG